ncbi:hypothetical protein LTR85_002390 [Meristemomyces frigidus]|nr:hypothetical protein LTR85_002390 [Meristemomyces frigidus]
MASEIHSRLLGLSAELRNRIWLYSISVEPQTSVECQQEPASPSTTSRKPSEDALTPSLTQACRQTRSEALPIFLSSHSITIDYTELGGRDRVVHWLAFLGPNARYLRRLKVLGVLAVKLKLYISVPVQTTLSVEIKDTAGPVQFAVECSSDPQANLKRHVYVAEKTEALGDTLRDLVEDQDRRTLSGNDWITVLHLVDGFFDRSYAPHAFAKLDFRGEGEV